MKTSSFSQISSLFVLLLLVVFMFLFIFPQRDKMSLKREQLDSAVLELQSLQGDLNALNSLSENVAKSQATKNALLGAVPQGPAQDELILELSGIAEDLGFDLNAMNFTLSVEPELGQTMQISVNFSGTYAELIPFLRRIESAKRLMNLRSLSVQRTASDSIVFNLSIETYYQ